MIIKKVEIIRKISGYLPYEISTVLTGLDENKKNSLCEIRLRQGMPVVLVFTDRKCFITKSGRVSSFNCTDSLIMESEGLNDIFNRLCGYSVYSYTEQIKNGFITLSDGIRIGVYGTAVTENSNVCSVRCIRGLNIRIPGFHQGCSDGILDLYKNDPTVNLLICGPPLSGKTTVLKDLCRKLSDDFGRKICVIDERFEFNSEYLGVHTDVLSGYPKNQGIDISVRTLSPEIILIDEIGMNGETEKIIECMNCGVSFVMTMHCSDKKDLYRKMQFSVLAESGAVDYCVFLKDKSVISEIVSAEVILNERDSVDSTESLSGTVGNVSFIPSEKTC